MARRTSLLAFALISAVLLALGGCATPRMIDSDVQSFTAATPAVRPALYRFERLPSQTDAVNQDQLEALATQALAKVGLTPAPLVSGAVAGTAAAAPTARYAVQVTAQISAILSPYATPYGPPYGGGYWGLRLGGRRNHMGLWFPIESNWFRHAVQLVLRDSRSGQTVYETRASFDGPWADSANLMPVILDAALNGYPQPPAGPRKVVIELPAMPADAAEAP